MSTICKYKFFNVFTIGKMLTVCNDGGKKHHQLMYTLLTLTDLELLQGLVELILHMSYVVLDKWLLERKIDTVTLIF